MSRDLSAMGRMALPDTPPYVVRFCLPTDGQADASDRRPIRPGIERGSFKGNLDIV